MRFQWHEFPAHTLIYRWVNEFLSNGSANNVINFNTQLHSGRSRISKTSRNIDAVRDSLCRSQKSVRRREHVLGKNRESVWKNSNAGFPLHPYTTQTKQKLTPADMRKRVFTWPGFLDIGRLMSRRCDPKLPWGQSIWQEPPDYPWSESSIHKNNERSPKGWAWECHRDLCVLF